MSGVARRANASCTLDVPASALEPAGTGLLPVAAAGLGAAALERLRQHGVVHFRLAPLALARDRARHLAAALAAALRAALQADWGDLALTVEVDRVQPTEVPAGHSRRSLLPHHDAAHCSYLSPSRLDLADWQPAQRCFHATGYTTGRTHKIYQGIFVEAAGSGASLTTYYPLIPLLAVAWRHRGGGTPTVAGLAGFLAENLVRAHGLQAELGHRYLSVAAALGSRLPMFHAAAPHCAEATLPPGLLDRHPALAALASACPCGRCAGPAERVFCASMADATGLGWADLAARFECAIETATGDFVIGNNLVLLHGGAAGAADRLLLPICLVCDVPAGPAYEQGLATLWRQRPLAALLPGLEWPEA